MDYIILFLFMPYDFLVENWTFEYYNVVFLEIRFSPFPKVCCFLIVERSNTLLLVTFCNHFFFSVTIFLVICGQSLLGCDQLVFSQRFSRMLRS